MQICGEFTLLFTLFFLFLFSLLVRVLELEWPNFYIYLSSRVTGQSPSQYVQPAGWSESCHHSLHAAGSFDRGYCSVRKKVSWSQFAPKSLVLRVHCWQNSLLCGWSYVCRTTVPAEFLSSKYMVCSYPFQQCLTCSLPLNTMNHEAFHQICGM